MKSSRQSLQRLTLGTLASCKVLAYIPTRTATFNLQKFMGLKRERETNDKRL